MRVNVDDKMLSDPRVILAAADLGITVFEFIGRCIAVYMAAYHNRSPIMPRRNVDALAQRPGFVDAMLAEDLATPIGDDLVAVRLRGVTERIEFLQIQDAKRAMANAAKRRKAGLPPEHAPGLPPGRHPGLPYSPSPARDQDRTQDRDPGMGSAFGARKPKGRPKRTLAAMPADWQPNAAAAAKARELELDVAAQAEHFRDHHAAKGSTFADWDAAFRTWLGNALRFGPRSLGRTTQRGNDPTSLAMADLREAEQRERRAAADLFGDAPHPAEAAS